MENSNLKRVAIIQDSSGKCKYVGKVKLVDEQELNRLKNESNEIDNAKQRKKEDLQNEINELKKKYAQLEAKIKILMGEE